MRSNSQRVNNSRETPDNTIASLVKMAALPRLEIEPFSRDILKYKDFISVFEETVGASSCGSRFKLKVLRKLTIGAAIEDISKYTLMEAEQEYKQTKQKLAIIEDIQSGNPAKTPAELLMLSDKLDNAELILNDMNMYSELDTQVSILNIGKLLPNHLIYKWRDCAMKIKSSTMRYPNFSQFASYVKDAATSASDPVYRQINYSRVTANHKVSQQVSSYSISFQTGK